MWLINGPFDCAQVGDEETLKTKLLKTSRVYGVGRHQDSPLYVNNKKISRLHGQFIVGEHSEDDVSNGALVPTLSLRNNKTSALKVTRGENTRVINPESTLELESGDIIWLTGSIPAVVTWNSVVCFRAGIDDVSTVNLAACASLGIKVVTKHSRDVTHHLTPSLTMPFTPAMLYTLLTPARFVTPGWIVDLIRLGSDDDHGLEKTFNPPPESNFRPEVDSVLAEHYPEMAKKAAWAPNDDRKLLFEDMRFVFVVLGNGAGSECKAMADIVSRGGATRQLVNIEKEAEEQAKGASGTWGTVLKKRKVVLKERMRSGLVLVGEEETMTAKTVPKDVRKAWGAMVDNAKGVNMQIIHPSLIAQAILQADVSVLDCVVEGDAPKSQGASASKSFPDHIPSTHPEEPSQLGAPATQSRQASVETSQTSGAGPSRRLTRRATSQTPVPEPAPPVMSMEVEKESAAPAPARKPLKRRAKTANARGLVNELLGIDESTVLLDEPQSQSQSQNQEHALPTPSQDVVPPTPSRPGRLKRRAGTTPATQLLPDLPALQEVDEPPLKKFKALFEQSGQGRTDQPDGVSEFQLQALEEEESSQSQSQTQVQEKKRKTVDVDVEMQEAEGSAPSKRRAIEGMHAVEPSQPTLSSKPPPGIPKPSATERKSKSEQAKGAAPGKPDTDPTFLRAIASTKRGKKTEDEFDREFNKLRIARPDINNANDVSTNRNVEWGKEWNGLDDFEKDVGVRGNFMQIVEMEVFHGRQQPGQPIDNIRREDGLGARLDWDGREDFKKFKRKMDVHPRVPVQLVVNESQDYAAGPSYWDSRSDKRPRGFDDMSQSQENDPPRLALTQTSRLKSQSRLKQKPRSKAVMDVSEEHDDDEVEEAVGNVISKGKGKTLRAGKKVQALFSPGSDDEDISTGAGDTFRDDHEDLDLTLRSDKSQKEKTRGTKRKPVVPEDSDSDDGMNFGGFAKRAKRLKR